MQIINQPQTLIHRNVYGNGDILVDGEPARERSAQSDWDDGRV